MQVLQFWVLNLSKVITSYAGLCVRGLPMYEGLLVTAAHVHQAMAVCGQESPVAQLLRSKVAPKLVEMMVMLLDNHGMGILGCQAAEIPMHCKVLPGLN